MGHPSAPTGSRQAPVAEIRVASRAGEVFFADSLETSAGVISASGRWVRHVGADWREQIVRAPERRSWSCAEPIRITHLRGAA